MKNLGFIFALVLVLGVGMTGCSSTESRVDEPLISDSADTQNSAESANLGAASSGQGR